MDTPLSQSVLTELRKELKSGLTGLYKQRLRGVYLFGSYARQTAKGDSDLDVLIVLDEILHYAREIEYTGMLISRLSLKYGVSISRKILADDTWRVAQSAILRNLRAEAIAI